MAQSDNDLASFAGHTVPGYTQELPPGISIEEVVAEIIRQPPTDAPLAVVRFRVSLIPVFLVCVHCSYRWNHCVDLLWYELTHFAWN